ncbi:hypothetical protein POPTR_008G024601v4 [Populus trichocarpa]|uniref:non-specific serine/threonine protein kinase n=1 Tax=Populus trichocarpa TaxID=3694 RepID=B9HL19_POPTR|nr:hypothetical protein POPTR_008G024601v4 [Populus trichocarpa]
MLRLYLRRILYMANRELKRPLGQSCQKKLLTESERQRMMKLEELNKIISAFYDLTARYCIHYVLIFP